MWNPVLPALHNTWNATHKSSDFGTGKTDFIYKVLNWSCRRTDVQRTLKMGLVYIKRTVRWVVYERHWLPLWVRILQLMEKGRCWHPPGRPHNCAHPFSVLSPGGKHLARRNLCLEKTPFYHVLVMNPGCWLAQVRCKRDRQFAKQASTHGLWNSSKAILSMD